MFLVYSRRFEYDDNHYEYYPSYSDADSCITFPQKVFNNEEKAEKYCIELMKKWINNEWSMFSRDVERWSKNRKVWKLAKKESLTEEELDYLAEKLWDIVFEIIEVEYEDS